MSNEFLILGGLWFLRTFKYVLFWLFLWQLKEYHIGRFLDHFRTAKGKKLILDYFLLLKILILGLFSILYNFNLSLYVVLFLIYFIETGIFLRQIYLKSVKKPVLTPKALFLTAISLLVVFTFLYWAEGQNLVWLLAFDITLSIIISLIVLIFQPFFVILRNNSLRKAREKMKDFPHLKVVAITGSYGKTSTKEFLTTILKNKFKVLSTSDHQNSEIGVAKCILNDLKHKHEIFIAEVGAYNKGKVKEVCNILKPKIGIVTGVNEQHLALFGSLDNLLSGEGGRELAEFLEKDNLLVVNGDNKYCMDLIKRFNGKEKIYSESNKELNADIWAESITMHKNYISFLARTKKGELSNMFANVLGKQNVQNLLGAILVANELGMSFAEIAEACKNIKEKQAGMTLDLGKHGIEIIDSSYSANPDGVLADLDYLSIFRQKKVVVMPCLIELGGNSKRIHEEIGKKIGKISDMAIITSKDYFEQIKKGAKESGLKENKIILCDKPEDIYSMITIFCKSGDAVLLEGRVPAELIKLIK